MNLFIIPLLRDLSLLELQVPMKKVPILNLSFLKTGKGRTYLTCQFSYFTETKTLLINSILFFSNLQSPIPNRYIDLPFLVTVGVFITTSLGQRRLLYVVFPTSISMSSKFIIR